MKKGEILTVNGIVHCCLYFIEGESRNAAVLMPTVSGTPSFMVVKNICAKHENYCWDEVFYTEDVWNACCRCNKWIEEKTSANT